MAWPLFETFRLSFTDASLRKVTNYVGGWRNYDKIFNETFLTVIGRTFIWTFFGSLEMVIGMCGAVLWNAAVPGRNLFRILDHAAMDRAHGHRHLHGAGCITASSGYRPAATVRADGWAGGLRLWQHRSGPPSSPMSGSGCRW